MIADYSGRYICRSRKKHETDALTVCNSLTCLKAIANVFGFLRTHHISAVGSRQKVSRKSYQERNTIGWLSRATGILFSITLVVAVGMSFWLNWRIESGLEEMSRNSGTQKELHDSNNKLVAQRDLLSAEDSIAVAVRRMGLFSPSAGQIRRP